MARHRRSQYSIEALDSLPQLLDVYASVQDKLDKNPAGALFQLVRVTQALQANPSKFCGGGAGGAGRWAGRWAALGPRCTMRRCSGPGGQR